MEKEKIAELFMKGIDCSQVVEGAFAEELGITQEEASDMRLSKGAFNATTYCRIYYLINNVSKVR